MENNNEPAAGSGGRTWEKYSVPFFLKRVLREELGEDRSNHKFLEISVHAVLLDSGFVRLDLVQGMRANQVSYTVPHIQQHQGNNGNTIEAVVLEFRKWRQFMNLYGSFASGGSTPYRLRMDKRRFAPVIESVWENRKMNEIDVLILEKEVLEFWRIVKDGIALPLLIDLCTKAGLSAPSSLMCLPPELKMKILEPLRVVDIAKVGRVCKELRNLASNDELWKKKYAEEFGDYKRGEGTMTSWKRRFATGVKIRKRRKPKSQLSSSKRYCGAAGSCCGKRSRTEYIIKRRKRCN